MKLTNPRREFECLALIHTRPSGHVEVRGPPNAAGSPAAATSVPICLILRERARPEQNRRSSDPRRSPDRRVQRHFGDGELMTSANRTSTQNAPSELRLRRRGKGLRRVATELRLGDCRPGAREALPGFGPGARLFWVRTRTSRCTQRPILFGGAVRSDNALRSRDRPRPTDHRDD